MEQPKYLYETVMGGTTPGRETPDFTDAMHENGRLYHNTKISERTPDDLNESYCGSTPNYRAISDASHCQLPRYLYRVSSDQSGGTSEEGAYKSQSIKAGLGHTGFATIMPEQMKELLTLHLKSKTRRKGVPWDSPFISCTDSFMTAIYWGNVLLNRGWTNVQFHIIDTNLIQEPALIFHAYALAKALCVGDDINPKFYPLTIRPTYTEFLIWEKLLVQSATIPFRDLWIYKHFGLNTPIASQHRGDRLWQYFYQELKTDKPPKQPYFRVRAPSVVRDKLYPDLGSLPDSYTDHNYVIKRRQRRKDRRDLKPRVEMEENFLQLFIRIARQVKVDFQFDLLIAYLSMFTRFCTKESIVGQVAKVLKNDPMCTGFRYYGTGLYTSMKREVSKQQELMIDCCRALGRDIVLADHRPQRNLYVLRNHGPSGGAKITTQPLLEPTPKEEMFPVETETQTERVCMDDEGVKG